jgi:hypothetical protein
MSFQMVRSFDDLSVMSMGEVWVFLDKARPNDIVRVVRDSIDSPWYWLAEEGWTAAEGRTARAVAAKASKLIEENPELMAMASRQESIEQPRHVIIEEIRGAAEGDALINLRWWSHARQLWSEYTGRKIDNLTAADYRKIVEAVKRFSQELAPLARKVRFDPRAAI